MITLRHKVGLSNIILMTGLILSATVVNAGQLYRFLDPQGIPTLSKTLPAEIAQHGYDILDDQSLKLLETVPAALEPDALADHKSKQAKLHHHQEKQRRQALYDKNLLSLYPSETALIDARNKDFYYLDNKLNQLRKDRLELIHKLLSEQKEAADKELNGRQISQNLQQRLKAANQQLINNKLRIEAFQAEMTLLSQQYASEHQRLRELLKQAD